MRFSLPLFLTLISVFATTLAYPVGPVDSLSARDLADELDVRSVDEDLERRGAPYKLKAKPKKVSKAAQQARKSNVKSHVATTHVQKQITKQHLAAAYKAKGPDFKYKKPRSASKQKPNKPGYRADGRKNGFRLPKQPKTPKPHAVKGAPKTAKHQNTQAAAKSRTQARKAAGRANFHHAKTEYAKTTHMPKRGAVFKTPGGTKSYSGKDVRNAVFNSHHFSNNKVNHTPKPFRNDHQGPAGSRKRPLRMKGHGTEFPVTNKRGGYQGHKDIGTTRVITQARPDGSHKFKGVISHDERRPASHPGYNDHFKLPQVKQPRRH